MVNGVQWSCSSFDNLSASAMYSILQLRAEVFVVEQSCAYLDPDGDDRVSLHLTGCRGDRLVATARLLPPGVRYPGCSIGRVAIRMKVRGQGLGRMLMQQAIDCCRDHWPDHAITITAQQYLEQFYREFGFVTESEPFLEDGIMHLQMGLEAQK